MVIGTARLGHTGQVARAEHGRRATAGPSGGRRERPRARSATTACSAANVLLTAAALLTAGVLACAPSSTDADKLPPTVPNPATVQTEAGALAFYRQVVGLILPPAVSQVMAESGVRTDELTGLPTVPVGQGGTWTAWDSRLTTTLPDNAESYRRLHYLRGQAREARGFLATYALAPESTATYNAHDLRAHLYAAEGYADVLLADLYCSGLPLSTVDFQGDYTLTPGFPTDTVYARAVGLFDSALALIRDSTASLQPLAAVGKGRALLAQGRYAEAAAAVAGVSDGFQYRVRDDGSTEFGTPLLQGFLCCQDADIVVMADREGGTGLAYRSAGDPRTLATDLGGGKYFPAKYAAGLEIPLASGIEARLIEAEAALQAGSDAWLTILNTLRTDGTYDTQPNAQDPSQTDTLWHAGTGGTAGLGPLADPSAEAPAGPTRARVDLVFQERGFWLYLTAHRQGDLRRLLRRYAGLGYSASGLNVVYPSGAYPGGSGVYGDAIVAEVPASERRLNPQYTGCLHLGA